MRCLAPDRLALLSRGRLSAPKAEQARRHLAGCAACRTALARVESAGLALREAAALPPADVGSPRTEATIRWLRLPEARRVRPAFSLGLALTAAACGLFLWLARAPRPLSAPVRVTTLAPPAPPSEMGALITLLGGRVELFRDRRTVPLSADTLLLQGDRLSTAADARVAAEWGEGSGFLLNGGGEVALDRLTPAQQHFRLSRGELDVRVAPRPAGAEPLSVRTPGHVLHVPQVMSTWFTVAADGPRTTVEVLEGTVEVTEPGGSSSTLLTAPARAVFGPGRSKSAPLSARDAAQRRAASALNLVTFASLAEAKSATGLFSIASEPLGALAVDGVTLGPTPLEVRRPLGRHLVEVDRRGFLPLKRWVVIGPERGELRVALLPEPADSAPTGAVSIAEMIHQRAHQIRACYERSLKRDPSLAGTVTLRLRIDGAGRVARTHVDDSTLADPLVAECLRNEAAGWSFSSGRNATVVYPFVFRPQ